MPTSLAALVFLLLLSPIALTAQLDTPARIDGPKLTIVGSDTVDFGRQRPGTHRRLLHIRNDGSDTLRQITVHSGCSCVRGDNERTMLAPGDTMSIDLVAVTSDREEMWQRTISLTSNDPAAPRIPVVVRMTLKPDLIALSDINTVVRTPCPGNVCIWKIEVKNVGDSAIIVAPPFVEELRGVEVAFASTSSIRLEPGKTALFTGNVKFVGDDGLPSARIVVNTSSSFTSEMRFGYYYLAGSSDGK